MIRFVCFSFCVDDRVYCESTLTISEVKRWFLNVLIGCHVMTEAGVKDSYVMLQEGIIDPALWFFL